MALVDKDVLDHRRSDLEGPLYDRGNYEKIAVGIDWGTHYDHVVVMGLRSNGRRDVIRLMRVPVTNTYKDINADIDKIILELEPYIPDLILADIGFNGTKVNQLIANFGRDRVFGVDVNSAKSRGEVTPGWSDSKNTVKIDKLTNNISTLNDIKAGFIGFYKEVDDDLKLFIEHWKNVIIRDVEDDNTGELVKEITRKNGDHYAQSSVYSWVAMNKLTDTSDQVGTDFGYSSVPIDGTQEYGESMYD